MSSWDYRVIHRKYYGSTPEYDEDVYTIHEVYYDEEGRVRAISTNPSPVYANDLPGLKWVLQKMCEAYAKDVLEWDSIPDKYTKPFTQDDASFDVSPDRE